jgi:hypothetical protein
MPGLDIIDTDAQSNKKIEPKYDANKEAKMGWSKAHARRRLAKCNSQIPPEDRKW